VAGSPVVVRAETAQQGLHSPEKRQTRSDPSQGGGEDDFAVLRAQVQACPHGRVLESTENRPDDHCWRCDPENNIGTRQSRDHLFKHCYKRKVQQAVMSRVKEATKRGKQKWRVGDLLVAERYSPAVLDFLRSTHIGRTAPPVEENWDSEEEAEVEEMGDGRSSDPRRSWYWVLFFVFSFCLSNCVLSLMRVSLVFTCFMSLVLSQCAQFVGGGRRGCCNRARPSGQVGR